MSTLKSKKHAAPRREEARARALLKTPEQVRDEFDRRGESISEWARVRGFTPSLVFEVVSGRRKCRIGQSHRIAVALGMKRGEAPV